MTDGCSASIALISLPVLSKDMDHCGPAGTMGRMNFPKLLIWTAKAHQEKKLPQNTRRDPTVN